MILNQLCGRLKVLFLSIIGVFRRALCCFSRRRKQSTSESEDLVSIVVKEVHQRNYSSNMRERDWNSWDDTPQTVEEHIEHYRQKLVQQPTTSNEQETEPDFFQDMTPNIKPQPVLYIKQEDHHKKTDFSRLEAKVDIPIAISPDLEDWTEDNNGGWEELNSEETKQLIREKRKELRTQRQQNKLSRDGAVGISGMQRQQHSFAERISLKQS